MQVSHRAWRPDSGWSAPPPAPGAPGRSLVLAFVDPQIDAGPLFAELARDFPDAVVAACSSSGEIHPDEVCDGSASVSWLHFDTVTVRGTRLQREPGSSDTDNGRALGETLSGPDLRAAIVLSDGLTVNGTPLAAALSETVGAGAVVTGGLAGDGARFENTWVRLGDDQEGPGIVGIGLYGDALVVGTGSRGGWDPFGPVRKVTRSEGNVLYELDGQPALALYKKYLGERATGLPATALLFPLALLETGRDQPLVRTILSVDEDAQSMTFAGDVPQGVAVQLMRANLERLVDGAADAGTQASEPLSSDAPTFALAVSCVGRRLVLGSTVDEEIEALLESCPEQTVTAGFYSYGELAPREGGSSCELHNQTMTVTLLQEST